MFSFLKSQKKEVVYEKHIVQQGFIGILYENGAFVTQLEPGQHKWVVDADDPIKREFNIVDIRERSITIKGQEILTADKVAIRVSILVYFRVNDAEAALHNVTSYEDRIYEDVQLAARRFLASRSLDAILNDRNDISDAVLGDVKESASGYGVEILRADVKDLVFPGNLREIMNQVLETERRAEAKLIQARKEAEAKEIESLAAQQNMRIQLEIEDEQSLARTERKAKEAALKLQTDIEDANAIAAQPILLRLRELEVLKMMARSGTQLNLLLSEKGLTLFDDAKE